MGAKPRRPRPLLQDSIPIGGIFSQDIFGRSHAEIVEGTVLSDAFESAVRHDLELHDYPPNSYSYRTREQWESDGAEYRPDLAIHLAGLEAWACVVEATVDCSRVRAKVHRAAEYKAALAAGRALLYVSAECDGVTAGTHALAARLGVEIRSLDWQQELPATL